MANTAYSANFWKLIVGVIFVIVLAWLADLNKTVGDICVALIVLAYFLLLLTHPTLPTAIANLAAGKG